MQQMFLFPCTLMPFIFWSFFQSWYDKIGGVLIGYHLWIHKFDWGKWAFSCKLGVFHKRLSFHNLRESVAHRHEQWHSWILGENFSLSIEFLIYFVTKSHIWMLRMKTLTHQRVQRSKTGSSILRCHHWILNSHIIASLSSNITEKWDKMLKFSYKDVTTIIVDNSAPGHVINDSKFFLKI